MWEETFKIHRDSKSYGIAYVCIVCVCVCCGVCAVVCVYVCDVCVCVCVRERESTCASICVHMCVHALHSISRCFNEVVTDITSVLPSLSVNVSGQTRCVPPSHTTSTIPRISGIILNEKGLLVKKTEDNTRGFGNETSDSSNDGSSDDDNQDESKIHNNLLS